MFFNPCYFRKLLLPVLLLVAANVSIVGQNQKLAEIITLSDSVYKTRHGTALFSKENSVSGLQKRKEIQELQLLELNQKLYTVLELENTSLQTDTLRLYVEKIRHFEAAMPLINSLKKRIFELESENVQVYFAGLKQNLKILEEHAENLVKAEYCTYNYPVTKGKTLHAVIVSTDNDAFAPLKNDDRNYTGGMRIELTTDLMKMRIITLWNRDRILSYQGVFAGGELFTPNISDTSIFKTPTSYDPNDRPFASYQYIGRSKYRMHYRLPLRLYSEFSAGIIGSPNPSMVQALIHRDVTTIARKPYGWESQIADGGRFAWNGTLRFEAMLFSHTGDIFNTTRKLSRTMQHKPINEQLNFTGLAELNLGHRLTAANIGLGYSSQNFRKTNGNNQVKTNNNYFAFRFGGNLIYRYVVHNSMLEGFGILFTEKPDDDPTMPVDVYKLSYKEVQRNMLIAEFDVSISTRYTTFFYKLNLHTNEFNKPAAKPINGWGRVGVIFSL